MNDYIVDIYMKVNSHIRAKSYYLADTKRNVKHTAKKLLKYLKSLSLDYVSVVVKDKKGVNIFDKYVINKNVEQRYNF